MTQSIEQIFIATKKAGQNLVIFSDEVISAVLNDIATAAIEQSSEILEANLKDLDLMNVNDSKYDRLLLNDERIKSIANDIKNIAILTSPIGEIIECRGLENGLKISKVRVPLGVIGVIYEARPNVSFDVFSLCFKTKNACLLKGGSDAFNSNTCIVNIIRRVLVRHNIDTNIINLLPTDRSATSALLQATQYVDVVIPRGSQGLINYVRENAKVPIIETGAGVVHTFIDKSANLEKAATIITNAKTRRASACNALDCVLIHKEIVSQLNKITAELAIKETIIYADETAFEQLSSYPKNLLFKATKEHFGTEFLANKLAIKTVEDCAEAITHIAAYSSKHSEAIIAENPQVITNFLNIVDAAAVYANASTAFTDGAQFGLGAEIGISTQKLHARGPMSLKEITSYKWIVEGDGQVRS